MRLPVQKPMLSVLIKHLNIYYEDRGQVFLQLLYSTIFCTMYYGLFRIGEIAKGDHPVLARDVHIARNKKKISFILRSTKTLYKNMKPQIIKISSTQIKDSNKDFTTGHSLSCPYNLLRQYLQIRGKYKHLMEPFFIFADGSPVQPKRICECFHLMVRLANFQHPHLYQVHGIRAGRSCDLLKYGLSVEEIKKIGCWKSHAVYRYLR